MARSIFITKTRRQNDKTRRTRAGRHPRRLLAVGGGAVLAIAAAIAVLVTPIGRDVTGLLSGGGDDGVLTAAIVDQLELTVPNPEFVSNVTGLLEDNGYTVDYIPGADVTVDLYRDLPKHDYELIILRVHSTAEISRGESDVTSVSLFTGQLYSEDLYYEEQLSGAVGFAQYTADSPKLFGVTAEFVRNSMEGRFDDTVVLMMGCQGFINAEGAEAFADRGARTFIGWDGLVSAQHTDAASSQLLQYLIQDGIDTRDAIDLTMAELGPDPDFGSQLVARP